MNKNSFAEAVAEIERLNPGATPEQVNSAAYLASRASAEVVTASSKPLTPNEVITRIDAVLERIDAPAKSAPQAPADVDDLDQAELTAKLMKDGMSLERANGLAYETILARADITSPHTAAAYAQARQKEEERQARQQAERDVRAEAEREPEEERPQETQQEEQRAVAANPHLERMRELLGQGYDLESASSQAFAEIYRGAAPVAVTASDATMPSEIDGVVMRVKELLRRGWNFQNAVATACREITGKMAGPDLDALLEKLSTDQSFESDGQQ